MKRAGSMLCPVILGRDDLLDLLDDSIAETRQGRGSTLFLSAPAGLGKTRLIRATIRKAEAAGLRVDGGSVAPQDHQVPLASIREMAVGMRGNAAWGTLSEDLLAIDGHHDGDALGARRLIVRAAADRILAAIDRPTLLIFDDLHWTDEMSLEVIGELARHSAERALFLLAGYRADEFRPDTIHREWRARLLSQRHAEEVRLRPLTREETGTATTLILGGELPAPREVVDAVHDRTNGIPLHIEELLAALGDDERRDGRRIRDAHVPDTIGDAVLARLARLSGNAQLVARAGAVIGRCFSPDVIAGLLDRPLVELEPTIAELVDASILYPFDYIDQGYYDFRHQLLRDAIYGAVPPSQLRKFHAQAAEFVMTLEGSSVVHASRHYERAGLRPQAFRASMTAAQAASRISARQEAYELYRRAVDNMPPDLPITEQAQLYSSVAGAAGAIELNQECYDAAAMARALWLEAGRPLEAAEMLGSMSVLTARDGSPADQLRAMAEQALAEIQDLPVTREREVVRGSLLSSVAANFLWASDLESARTTAMSARELSDSVGDRETALEAELCLARIDIAAGRIEQGLSDGMRAAREARDAGYESVGVTGYRNLAIMAARVMDHGSAKVAIGEGLQYADAIEQSHCRQMIATTLAILDWAAGNWEDADARARQELVDRGCRRGVIGALDAIGLVALGHGRLDEARRWLDESLDTGKGIGEAQLILTPLWGLAEVDLAAGSPADAVARCGQALDIVGRADERALLIPFVVTGTRALLAARRPDDAERWLATMRDELVGWEAVAEPALAHADGLVKLAAGSLSAGREAFEIAIRGWDERRRFWEASWARLDLAHALIRSNRYGEASTLVVQVRTRAEIVESPALMARADELARIGRGRGTTEEPWHPLTAREFEVARLIAEGLTNGEIAEQLDIAPKTASSHVEHILAKLGVTRRAEIAAWTATVNRPVAADRTGGGTAVATRR